VETSNHLKNGATPKSLMSRKNLKKNKMKKILFGGLAGAITFMVVSWVGIYMAFGDYYYANLSGTRDQNDMIIWAALLSALVLGFFLSIIFSRSNTTGIISGAKYGAILGLLIMSFMDFTLYTGSIFFNNLSIVIFDIVINTCVISITGGVVAWVMGMGKKEA
jgi:hypothetical protein